MRMLQVRTLLSLVPGSQPLTSPVRLLQDRQEFGSFLAGPKEEGREASLSNSLAPGQQTAVTQPGRQPLTCTTDQTNSSPPSFSPPLPVLSPDLIIYVLSHLPPTEIVCSGRLISRDICARLTLPRHRTADLSQPVPPHVSSWAEPSPAALHTLSFRRKLHTLSYVAASSGSETNLDVAWRMLRPCLSPHRSPDAYGADCWSRGDVEDPGTAAVRQGHAHLLPYMVRQDCPVDPIRTLAAAAQYGELPVLQDTWMVLAGAAAAAAANPCNGGTDVSGVGQPGVAVQALYDAALAAAARSRTADAMQKLQWLVGEGCWRHWDLFVAAAAGGLCVAMRLRGHGSLLSSGEQGKANIGCACVHGCPRILGVGADERSRRRRGIWDAGL